MDTVWIQYGYNMDTVSIQYGYNMDTVGYVIIDVRIYHLV